MYGIGQTLYRPKSDDFVLYLGSNDEGIILIQEDGTKCTIKDTRETTHIEDACGNPIFGQVQNVKSDSAWFGEGKAKKDARPDTSLRTFIEMKKTEKERLRNKKVKKEVEKILRQLDMLIKVGRGEKVNPQKEDSNVTINDEPYYSFLERGEVEIPSQKEPMRNRILSALQKAVDRHFKLFDRQYFVYHDQLFFLGNTFLDDALHPIEITKNDIKSMKQLLKMAEH